MGNYLLNIYIYDISFNFKEIYDDFQKFARNLIYLITF